MKNQHQTISNCKIHSHTHTKHFRIGEILLEIEKLEKEKHFENLNGGIFEFIKLFYSSLTAIAF